LRTGNSGRVNNICRRPPDTIQRDRGGGGDENGHRLLTCQECRTISKLWRKKLGILNSNSKIELYEMIKTIEKGCDSMPGKAPQRKELIAFGELQDGVIVCVCMGYLNKCKCPWDLSIVSMAQMNRDINIEENMVNFIKDVCLEHACVPDYSILEKWEAFYNRGWIKSPRRLAMEKAAEMEGSISTYYSNCNKAPAIVLDNHAVDYIGPYWYKTRIPNDCLPKRRRAILYFRQKSKDNRDEFEIRFFPPVTGVSSGRGTVGAAIIIDTDNDKSFTTYKYSDTVIRNVKSVSDEILSRIKHPMHFFAMEDTFKERTDFSNDSLTGKEILRKLRDDFESENWKNRQHE
jgi:hypothetical protein